MDLAETGNKQSRDHDDDIASATAVTRLQWNTDIHDYYYYYKHLEETAKSRPQFIDFLGVGTT